MLTGAEYPGGRGAEWGWVWVATGVVCLAAGVGQLFSRKKTLHEAFQLVAPQKEAYGAAWRSALAADGGEGAAAVLAKEAGELQRGIEAEAAAFEATVPRFGDQFWYLMQAPVRDGPFTKGGVKPRQPVCDIDALFQQARVLNPHFQDWVRSWTGWGSGARHIEGPVKHAGRVIAKVIRNYDRDVAAVTDIVRCTVTFPDLRGVLSFFREVVSRSDAGGNGMLRIRRIKNRLDTSYDADAKSMGYRDLALLVEVGWVEAGSTIHFLPVRDWKEGTRRHVCEIQAHLRSVHDTMLQGTHDKYVTYRDMTAS